MSPPPIRALWSVDAAQPGGAELDDEALTRCYARGTAPTVRVNFVTSVDGAVEVDGYSAGLSGPADKRVFGILRKVCDGLLVGAGTMRHEGYRAIKLDEPRRAWRLAQGLPAVPTLVVVSGRLDVDPASPVFTEAPVRPVVLTTTVATAPKGLDQVADVVRVGERELDLTAGLAVLRERGLNQILCEGGPHLLGTLTAADLVDELCLTVSPLLAGPGGGRITAGPHRAGGPLPLRLHHSLLGDDLLLLRYTRR
ncbi:Pyrimidine reductase, riboflavin biosynthesis [Asanoa hainanensis]|uniref:Pyrimidine reductase, riboflavin biosynthesis n=1 Tax=Asanoa hainanensis TaxID=560556 RepID=A0A239LPF6_9ACTN|nr:pyrimidine reductase family protein [Asanoa hainanensis]SNT31802.1 Pyrimidine reductase, riboflavin biosynthesis [Asanoa hainanensis]